MLSLSRLLIVGFALLLVGQGVAAIASGELTGGATIVGGAVVLAAVVFEWRRGRGERAADASRLPVGFRPTEEVFLDPTSGRRTRVWVDPTSGERRYRPDDQRGG